jgi:hypothetical protein
MPNPPPDEVELDEEEDPLLWPLPVDGVPPD